MRLPAALMRQTRCGLYRFPKLTVQSCNHAFGKRPGDRVQISIAGPNGFEHSRSWDFDKYQAEYFLAAGRRTPDNGLPVGTYTSRVSLIRDGQVLQTDVRQLKVVPAD